MLRIAQHEYDALRDRTAASARTRDIENRIALIHARLAGPSLRQEFRGVSTAANGPRIRAILEPSELENEKAEAVG